jgi:hypothetical protein
LWSRTAAFIASQLTELNQPTRLQAASKIKTLIFMHN